MDGQTREGEQSGERESMEQTGERDGGGISRSRARRTEVSSCRASAPLAVV